MSTEIFTASVQYNDLLGTVAADRADEDDLESQLIDTGVIVEGEDLIGIDVYTSDSMQDDDNPIWVTVLIKNEEDDSIREHRMEMTPEEFFSYFKRFNIKISSSGELTDEEIIIDE